MILEEIQDLIDKEKFQAIAKERKRLAKWLASKRILDGTLSRADRESLENGYTPEGY